MERGDLEKRIEELEAQLKEEKARAKPSERPLSTQSFLVALPIILTVGLGFVANSYQSNRQHQAQQEQQAREFAQTMERQRRQNEVDIIIKASEVPTSLSPEQQDVQRARNLLWFADAGYVRVEAETMARLREAGNVAQGESAPLPVVQSAGETAAVAGFQRQQALQADGILGPRTCVSVYEAEQASPGSADQQLLARCRERFPQRSDR